MGWLFLGGMVVPVVVPLALWFLTRLDGRRALALGASLWGLWFGATFVHLSELAWLGEGRDYHAISGTCALAAGLLGLAGTFAPVPNSARRLLYILAGLLLLPLMGSFRIFALGMLLTPIAVATFWVLAYYVRTPVAENRN
jgi:hypothetical protein